MKYFISFLTFFFTSIFLLGQIDSVSIYYSNQINESQLKYKIDVLADDTLLGRETAELGQQKAEKFIISEFKKHNILPGNNGSYLQYFNVYKLSYNQITFDFNGTQYDTRDQLISYNMIKDCLVSGEGLVFCGYGISTPTYDDYRNSSLEDKLVFLLEGSPLDENGNSILSEEEVKKWNSNHKALVAKGKGAKGVVFIRNDYQSYLKVVDNYLKHGKTTLYDKSENETPFPTIYMDEKIVFNLFEIETSDIDHYVKKVKATKKVKSISKDGLFTINIKAKENKKSTSNVLAKIESDDPLAPWIVISAHYDHIGYDHTGVFNGADDNGSGTASVLELSRVFKLAYDEGWKPKKNLLFILVSGEEKGLLGSEFYAQNPIYSIENTMVNLNIDMVGRVDKEHEDNSNYIYVIGADRISQKLHDINEKANDNYVGLELDYTYNESTDPNRYYERSDHYNFAKNGIPVIFYFNGTHEDYHRIGDTKDKIDYEALLKRTQLFFHTAWELSQMDGNLLN